MKSLLKIQLQSEFLSSFGNNIIFNNIFPIWRGDALKWSPTMGRPWHIKYLVSLLKFRTSQGLRVSFGRYFHSDRSSVSFDGVLWRGPVADTNHTCSSWNLEKAVQGSMTKARKVSSLWKFLIDLAFYSKLKCQWKFVFRDCLEVCIFHWENAWESGLECSRDKNAVENFKGPMEFSFCSKFSTSFLSQASNSSSLKNMRSEDDLKM